MENATLIEKFGAFEVWAGNDGKFYGIDTSNPENKPRPYRTKEYAIEIARSAAEFYQEV